jgi:uncharacterized repeat protein (TIGR01451 family)
VATSDIDRSAERLTHIVPFGARLDMLGRPRSTHRARFAALAVGALALLLLVPGTSLAADTLSVTTPYPAVSVAPGSKVSFNLTIKSNARRQVHLAVSGAPSGWTAALHGGGFVIDAVTVEATGTPPEVRLDVNVPPDAPAGTTTMTVTASGGGLSDSLPLSITVSTEAAGSVAMTTDFPTLQGPSSGTFSFSLTLANNTAQDLTFALVATGPPDGSWTVTATPSGQSQAASAKVDAGSTSTISVSANPPADVAAGDYEIDVSATSGAKVAQARLGVTITGNYKMTLTTPDGVLNAHGSAGSQISRTLTIQNTGSAPVTNVKVSTGTIPSGWTVKYDPSDTVQSIDPNKSGQVTALITPSGDAVAGDYVVTFNASGSGASGSSGSVSATPVDIRVTVETSLIGGLLGIVLIVIVIGGLLWVFRTYGRR